jgi:hypothetical protein
VAETPEGELTLTDSFVTGTSGEYERPTLEDGLPHNPQVYQAIEWASQYAGNALDRKDPRRWVCRLFHPT